jgi:hypothetical protein
MPRPRQIRCVAPTCAYGIAEACGEASVWLVGACTGIVCCRHLRRKRPHVAYAAECSSAESYPQSGMARSALRAGPRQAHSTRDRPDRTSNSEQTGPGTPLARGSRRSVDRLASHRKASSHTDLVAVRLLRPSSPRSAPGGARETERAGSGSRWTATDAARRRVSSPNGAGSASAGSVAMVGSAVHALSARTSASPPVGGPHRCSRSMASASRMSQMSASVGGRTQRLEIVVGMMRTLVGSPPAPMGVVAVLTDGWDSVDVSVAAILLGGISAGDS